MRRALSLLSLLGIFGCPATQSPGSGADDPLLHCDSDAGTAVPVFTGALWADVVASHCSSCHGPDGASSDYGVWDSAAKLQAAAVGARSRFSLADGALKIVDPGAPANSSLMLKVLGGGSAYPGPHGENVLSRMPKGLPALSAAQLTRIHDWICGGARAE